MFGVIEGGYPVPGSLESQALVRARGVLESIGTEYMIAKIAFIQQVHELEGVEPHSNSPIVNVLRSDTINLVIQVVTFQLRRKRCGYFKRDDGLDNYCCSRRPCVQPKSSDVNLFYVLYFSRLLFL